MNKIEFLKIMVEAYNFADYAMTNLDAADECLADARETAGTEKLDFRPFFETLLKDTSRTERAGIMVLLEDYFFEESTPSFNTEETAPSS
jgi:hypothetical protein